jgi:4-amino-4-deoxy-L-arabinose transferase-like glycosyltransferase
MSEVTVITSTEVVRKLALLIASFLALSFAHAVLVPIFEGPDEVDNLTYIRYIDHEGHLVTPATEMTYELEHLSRGLLPPLWFLTMLPVYQALDCDQWAPAPVLSQDFLRSTTAQQATARAGGTEDDLLDTPLSRLFYRHGGDEAEGLGTFEGATGSVRILRMTSALWGALALLASWLTLRRVLGCGHRALWFTALLAWTPQLQFLSGNLTMDLTVAALGTLALWAMVEWIAGEGEPWRWGLLAGLFTGLCALTKLNGLVLIPVMVLAVLLASRQGRLSGKSLWISGLALGLVAGPYFFSSWAESGHPLWMWHYQGLSDYHNPPGFEPAVWNATGIWTYLQTIFLSWFADFGWMSVWFDAWISLPVMGVMILASAVGSYGILRRLRGNSMGARAASTVESRRAAATVFLFLAAVAIQLAELWFNLSFSQPQGRHLYPFLVAVIFPVGLGLERMRLLKPFALLSLALSLAAFPMLVDRLRPAGWNKAPGIAVTDMGRAPQPEILNTYASVRWLVDGDVSLSWPIAASDAVSGGPAPTLYWQTRPGFWYEAYLGLDNRDLQDLPWTESGILVRATSYFKEPLGGVFSIPEGFWQGLSPGQELSIQIVELTSAGEATGYSFRRRILR